MDPDRTDSEDESDCDSVSEVSSGDVSEVSSLEDEEDDVSVSTEPVVVVGHKRPLPKGIQQMGYKFRIKKATQRRESRSGTALRR